jgi:lysozyme
MDTPNTPNRVTRTSDLGIALICHFEELRTSAYLCPAKVWTIGYGTTRYPNDQRVKPGDKITREVAMTLLQKNLRQYEKAVDDMTPDTIAQHQFDSLVALCYNIGAANFKQASLLNIINAGILEPTRITGKFLLWNKATIDGRLIELDGLTRRRRSEAHLFNTGEICFFQSKRI